MTQLPRLQISENQRFLVTEEGKPFFWLGDTAWELFHRLSEVEARHYLHNRAGKGFNVIQAVALAELQGMTKPNANGDLPFANEDPGQLNETYFRHVDFIVKRANELGLYIGFLPCWGSYVKRPAFDVKTVFDSAEKARAYGEFLGARYKDAGLVWILGGDRPADGVRHLWDAMAVGIRSAGAEQLMTYHPFGYRSSSIWLHDADWLDFNMIQSGHGRLYDNNYDLIQHDYQLSPTKPVFEGEPCYEDLAIGFNPQNGYYQAEHCRVAAYRGVFAGGFGHTYGCSSIWQMHVPGKHEPACYAYRHWRDSMNLPGSFHMRHLKHLMLSRPFTSRIPDNSLLQRENHPFQQYEERTSTNRIIATRDGSPGLADATYIMAYLPFTQGITLNTQVIAGKWLKGWWYDPRNGCAYPEPVRENTGTLQPDWHSRPWSLPIEGRDWVYVVDNADAGYPTPGMPPVEYL